LEVEVKMLYPKGTQVLQRQKSNRMSMIQLCLQMDQG